MKKHISIFLTVIMFLGLILTNVKTTVLALDGTLINDDSKVLTYSGKWISEINSSSFNSDDHYTNEVGAYVQYTFTGSDVSWVGQKDSNFGKADVYIDDVLQTTVDCYSSTNSYQNILFQKADLQNGTHTIKIVCKSNVIDLDVFKHVSPITVTPPPPPTNDPPPPPPSPIENFTVKTNDDSDKLTYSGAWFSETSLSSINNDDHYTTEANAYVQYTFIGSDVSWIGQKDSNFGKADVYIDGVLQTTIDCYSSTNSYQNILFQKTNLTNGTHTIKVVCKSNVIDLDAFGHISTVTFPPPTNDPPIKQYANLAANILPTGSCSFKNISRISDGDKNTSNYSDSAPSIDLQWIQLDLYSSYNINTIKLWHYFGDTRRYHDVIVQLSNDPTFSSGVTTVFNNDTDNSAKLGIGLDNEYVETSTGKVISFNSINARYVRFYTNGSTANKYNHYVEIEIYDGVTPLQTSTPKPLIHASTFLNLPTYDGSNMSTHPAVEYFPNTWNGHKYWMVMTPNTGVSDWMENPCVYTSEDGLTWSVPSGLSNPIVPRPKAGHNCDPDIIFNSITNELWIYYVESDDLAKSYVKLIKSSDGINWTTPQVVIDDSRAKYSTLSPTIVYMDKVKKYYMWSVNTGNRGWNNQSNFIELRESLDGIVWSNPIPVTNFTQSGQQIWHIFIRYIPSKDEYWCIFAAYPNGSTSDNTMLYYAKSLDGVNWTTYTKPALDKGTSGKWDDKEIYRSCFIYDPNNDMFKVWYSGIKNSGYVWKIGYTENSYENFIYSLTHK